MSAGARRPLGVGDPAPDFALAGAAGRARRLSDLRGSPVVLAFPAHAGGPWDPARAEYVDAYNRLVARVPGGAGARLLHVGGAAGWRELTFADDAAAIPVVAEDDAAVARAYGAADGPAVFVLDEAGTVRWRSDDAPHPAALPHPDAVAAALAALAPGDAAGDGAGDAGWSRRAFVATLFGATLALALAPGRARAARGAAGAPADGGGAGRTLGAAVPVTLHVNGRDLALQLEPRVTLLDALREYAGLTGTKKGCAHGQCGACTVHVEGRRVLSCMTLAVMQQGKAITTIEGLAPVPVARAAEAEPAAGQSPAVLHPMQQAFITHDGYQCGYCTPGQIMSAVAVTREPWGPDDADVREAMSGNICRCGAYPGIVAAIQEVRGHTASRSAMQPAD
ncbi:hypothetical protein tb265_13080 [Gemmatimonadetes bacterium T265]|nr:hypothetical protein tb265_13080 [Gemmatimonadetes bacterium T265]